MLMNIRQMIYTMLMYVCQIFPVDNNKVLFSSFDGGLYNDSPRIISEALSRHENIKQVWVLPNEVEVPSYIKKVNRTSPKLFYEMATSKVWVDNTRKRIWARKKKNQFYVQTWHGGVALKKVERDAEEMLTKDYVKRAKHDSAMADVFVSESDWRTKNYLSAFWYDGEVIKGGVARKQAVNLNEVKNKVYKYFNVDPSTKILLYAPTFRKESELECYNIDYGRLLVNLEKKFGGKWIIVIRLHPNILALDKTIDYSERIVNGTRYPVLNELMTVSDAVITDFSGCMFDALRMGKKLFLYASDYEKYVNTERGLYFDLKDFPASLSKSNDELEDNITMYDDMQYNAEREKLVEKLGFYETDGTGIVIDYILQHCKE